MNLILILILIKFWLNFHFHFNLNWNQSMTGRLLLCVCVGCLGGWMKWNDEENLFYSEIKIKISLAVRYYSFPLNLSFFAFFCFFLFFFVFCKLGFLLGLCCVFVFCCVLCVVCCTGRNSTNFPCQKNTDWLFLHPSIYWNVL